MLLNTYSRLLPQRIFDDLRQVNPLNRCCLNELKRFKISPISSYTAPSMTLRMQAPLTTDIVIV